MLYHKDAFLLPGNILAEEAVGRKWIQRKLEFAEAFNGQDTVFDINSDAVPGIGQQVCRDMIFDHYG